MSAKPVLRGIYKVMGQVGNVHIANPGNLSIPLRNSSILI